MKRLVTFLSAGFRAAATGGRGEVMRLAWIIVVRDAAGGGADRVELEARGANGGLAGGQRADAAFGGGAEAGAIAIGAGARGAAAGSLGGLHASRTRRATWRPMGITGRRSRFRASSIPTFVGPFTTHGRARFGDAERFRLQLHPALPGVEGGGERRRRSDVDGTAEQVAAQVARAYLAAVRADADVETAQANVTLSRGGAEAGREPEGGRHRHGHRDHARPGAAGQRPAAAAGGAERAAAARPATAARHGPAARYRAGADRQAAIRAGGRGDAGAGARRRR